MKPRVVFDCEVFRDFFCVCFRNVDNERSKTFQFYNGHPIDRQGIIRILHYHTVISFNGNVFDVPIIKLALRMGATNALLKHMSDAIILQGLKPWEAERQFNLPEIPWLDHIDLIEVAPGTMVSLKIYGGRLHSKRMQDLPIDPHDGIAPEQRAELVSYCMNDLQTTIDLYNDLQGELELREAMTAEYGIDLRSKSDAQIAEAVIRNQLEQIKGERLYRPEFSGDYMFRYQTPHFISFKTDPLRALLQTVQETHFGLSNNGSVEMPKALESLKIKIGESIYRLGIGGLHSTENRVCHFSDDENVLIDADVGSYYPSIVLVCGLYPIHLGQDFLRVYRRIVTERLAAKRRGAQIEANGKKIMTNGAFGKFGSPWSTLYSPNLMIQVTLTGQLALLMLIEDLTLAGIPVVSANTDGVVSKCPRHLLSVMNAIIKAWEFDTGFDMEFAEYDALYSRDVNSYLGIKADGGIKQKGAFAFAGAKGKTIEKNPANNVCIDAVIAYLKNGTPLEETIRSCIDIRRFVTIRQVRGGAVWKGQYLGRAVRWYYAEGEKGHIEYRTNGNKVARTDGARPLMLLPDEFPSDVCYRWYVNEAIGMLGDLGVL